MTRSVLFFDDVVDADPAMGGPSRPQDVQERMTREAREREAQTLGEGFSKSHKASGVPREPEEALRSQEPLELLTRVASLIIQGQFSVSMTSDSES